MPDVYVAISAFTRQFVSEKGHSYFIDMIAKALAEGVEFRRELLPDAFIPTSLLHGKTAKYELASVYSAPISLWNEEGGLNASELIEVMDSAAVERYVRLLSERQPYAQERKI